jgi:translocation and assembly module TamB
MVTSENPVERRRTKRRTDSPDVGAAADERPEPRRSRGVRWLRLLLVGGVLTVVLLVLLPSLLKPWAVSKIRAALPGQTKIGSIQLAWWSPVTASDLEISPDADESMLRIGHLNTGTSLWSVVVSGGVERVSVDDVSLDIRHDKGTTNLDRWLEDLHSKKESSSEQPIHVTVTKGRLRVFLDSKQPEFEVGDVTADVAIDGAKYVVKASGQNPQASQKTVATIQLQLDERNAIVETDGFELSSIEPWFRSIDPASRLRGELSATGQVSWNDDGFAATVERAVATNIDIDLPLYEVDQILIASVEASGRLDASRQAINVDGDVRCEFGSFVARKVHLAVPKTKLDWKSIVAPFRGDCDIDIDIAKTTTALPWLIPVRDDLQLTSGRAKMKIRGGTEPHERLTGEVSLSDVSARGRQQEMRWEQPVLLSVDIRRDQGLQVENLHLDSDFLVARLNGSLESGNGTVSGDLGKLHHELSRWLDLPVTNMGGQLTGELHWELDGDQVVGRGELDVLDALVKRTDETPWSDARVHVDWKSVALLSETSTPALQSADFVLQTSTQDRIEWHARQSDAGLAWSGDALIKLEHLPRAELADGTGTTIIEGTLIGDIEGTTVDKAYNITTVNATIDQLHIRGENVLVREPTVIFRASGSVEKEQGVAHLDQFEFTSTTVAFGGKNLLVDWRDQLSVKFDAATRADLSKLDRWIPASQSDLYRWEGEFVGNVALELALAETSVSWSGSVDKFAMRRAPVGGVSGGLAGLNDTIWREAKLTSKGQLTFEFETQSLLVDVSATSDAVELSLAGEVRDISTTPFAAFKGEIGYDYKHLQPNLQLLLGRSVKITGKGRQPIRLNGPVFVDSTEDPMDRPVVNSKLEAEAGVDWVSASGYGVNVGAGQLHAKLSGAVVSFTPLDFPLANGRLHAEPWVDLRSAPGRVFLKPGPVMEKVNITPDMCRTWIRFAAPLLANATRAEGQLTAQLDHAELPLGNPESASALGTLQIHEGRAGAGPLVREILALAGQMQSIIRKQPVNLGQSKLDWVTLPPQEIDFRLSEGAVYHQRFEMRVKDIHLVTSGTVYLDNDQTIDLICEVPVQDEWLKSNRLLSSLRGTTLRIPVTGTLSKPKINRQILGDLGKKMLRGATENLLRDQLERGLRDLFK